MKEKTNRKQIPQHKPHRNRAADCFKPTALALEDFKRNGDCWTSNEGTYMLARDSAGYMYPYHVTWGRLVHTAFDYSFTPETCLRILNAVLAGAWKHGEGVFLNFGTA